MSNTNTGGPAFPTLMREWRIEEGDLAGNTGFECVDPGMTLRDYFAAKAMQGYFERLRATQYVPHEQVAVDAYRMADAMLKARNQ